ncbi:MAG: ASKHA domain-containing protein [Treponema sp.]|nr:ASKHA domain-containing protein [Treponema sp.]
MINVSVISGENKVQKISMPEGGALLAALRAAGVYLPAICGGRGTCGKCRIRVKSGALPVSTADEACFSRAELDEGWRLACAAFPAGSLTVQIPESGEGQFSSVDNFEQPRPAGRRSGEAFEPQKSPRSFAVQLADAGLTGSVPQGAAGRLSFSELREASKLAAPVPEGGFQVYRDRGRIVRIGGGSEPLYAAAVDIGTTTLGFALVDLRSGAVAGRLSAVNRQREFGGDVISRIGRANSGDLSPLSRCVRKQITEGITALCDESEAEARDICKIAIAGNTTMLHLLLGLSCQTLGKTPFTPVTLDTVFLNFREITESDLPSPESPPACETVILPGISTYVGADIAAGLLFVEPHKSGAPAVFLDIGTNGEMALAHKGKILCTATAAGPAFEGGNILWGTGSVPGAISRVRFRDGIFEADTIGGKSPLGICGSGVVDTVYQGLKYGYIQPSGRFTEKVREEGIVLARAGDGRDIVFCQKDVRELQLGKSAIRSGLDALLNYTGLAYEDIQTLYIAGGFGFNLCMESAAGIGLIPEALLPRVSLIGNSALGGAVKYLLSPENDETLRRIIAQSEEFSLPEDKYFNAHFIDNVTFESGGAGQGLA